MSVAVGILEDNTQNAGDCHLSDTICQFYLVFDATVVVFFAEKLRSSC